eukprot:TRINITY_DN4964_c0_g1_i1.p1 TRINITY_DN4964_c0_g1~~TRINITY_DN4964_c0_g1_i1.p1  ORF type:complete len:151 (-),score=40.19 TRINITY_DN4964_c0_g1_i1:116-568(-)
MSAGSLFVTRRIIKVFLSGSVRSLGSHVKLPLVTNYREFENYRTQEPKSVNLIDVRNPSELENPGPIPGAINVPLSEIGSAFGELSPKDFVDKYGMKKPESNDPLVFFCLKGIRSQTAMDSVASLGYSNVSNYLGSYLDWAEKKAEEDKS